jgi:ABC-type uncharacterized transport system ATPase subunit
MNEGIYNVFDPELVGMSHAVEDGRRRWILFQRKQITVAEAVTLLTKDYAITDLSIKEPEIEDAVREIYENQISGV